MQTFLPHPDFAETAAVLDQARLGKQRVEVLQVLRAIELPEYGWANHPAVAMWRGRTPALVVYGLACVAAWRALGHADSTASAIGEFAPGTAGAEQRDLAERGLLPSWIGHEGLHRSHRSALVRKDPAFYRPRFPDVPDDLPYVWPGADPVDATAQPARPGRAVWVCRGSDATALGVLVGEGVLGLDTASGIDVAADSTAAGLRALLAELGAARGVRTRPGKALRQLEALVAEVAEGDEVVVPVHGGRALLLGRVTGPYAFAGPRALVPHRRPVRWTGLVPRAALDRPAQLQDPRALFRIDLALTDGADP